MKLTVKCFATLMPLTPPDGSLESPPWEEGDVRLCTIVEIASRAKRGSAVFWVAANSSEKIRRFL